MKVALIGAGGNAGSRILAELVLRGHDVKALARTPAKVPLHDGIVVEALDANDQGAVTAAICGCDAVISATKFKETDTKGLVLAITASDVKRYLVVGGAGSLFAPDGTLEMDGPNFPSFVKPEASAGGAFLELLRHSELDWTFLSPSRMFEPGQRTGKFRIGKDHMLFDSAGKSSISMEDFAIAIVDELEMGAHIGQRFTVGY